MNSQFEQQPQKSERPRRKCTIKQKIKKEVKVKQKPKQKQIHKPLTKWELKELNEKNFSNRRGLHFEVDILTLQRLGSTSYVFYDEKQTYNNKYNGILNRFYKSVPFDSGKKPDKFKYETEFHGYLDKYEGRRADLDCEILQLRMMLKKYQKQEQSHFQETSEKKIEFDEQKNQQRIQNLIKERNYLLTYQQEENMCYQLYIDQQFQMKIQSFSIKSINQIEQEESEQDLKQEFCIHVMQPPQLQDLQLTYQKLKFQIPLLKAPKKLLSFQDENALKITSLMLLRSLQQVGKGASSILWMQNLYIDLIKALFNVVVPNVDPPFIRHLCSFDIYSMLSLIQQQDITVLTEEIKPLPKTNDPQTDTETKLKFYPNFKAEEFVLYGSTAFAKMMIIIHEIYSRIQKLCQLQGKVAYLGKEYIICDSLLDLCFSFIRDKISTATWQTSFKKIFQQEEALYFIPLKSLVQEFKKLFYEIYGKEYQKLLQKWIYNTLGNDSLTIQAQKIPIVKIPTTQILKKLRYKCWIKKDQARKLSRIQTVDRLIIIHVFELQELY